jgi:lysophospholipase L1-like esterase
VKFIKILISILAFLTTYPLYAQTIVNLKGSSQSSDLVCPIVKKNVPPAAAISDEFEEVYSLPEDELLEMIRRKTSSNTNQLRMGMPEHADGKPYKIAIWGDSHTAAHFFSEELIRSMGLDNDLVLPSFIPPSMGRPGVRLPIRKFCQSPQWRFNYSYTGVNQEFYGPALLKLNANMPNSYLWIDFRAKNNVANNLAKLQILFSKTTLNTAKIGLQVDGRPEEILDIKNETGSHVNIEADQLFGVVKIRLIEGAVSIDGFVPTYRSSPKVHLDTFGIPSATMRGWLSIQKDYLESLQVPRDYDLVILEYGTNEGSQMPFDARTYTNMLRDSLKNFRAIYPQASCLLMGPTDRGVWYKKTYFKGKKKLAKPAPVPDFLMYSKTHYEITQIQSAVGKEFSCQNWSWQDAMGGQGGAYQWIKQSPPLMAKDLIHLTVQGYQETARQLSRDINLPQLIK